MVNGIGRNDPCPCGSGKKYKQCCLYRERHERIPRPASGFFFSERHTQQGEPALTRSSRRLAASCDPYHGLSPDQLHRLLVGPLTSPELISFPDPLSVEPVAPVITLFEFLAEKLGEKGAKATATGNLPRQLCRDAARMCWGDFLYEQRTQLKGINRETDFWELHVVHVLADIAGLIRKHRGRLILSRDCRRRLAESGSAGVYPRLFLGGTREYNWAYRGWTEELPLIQQAGFFTLYLLARYGGRTLSSVFYEDCFLRLFPLDLHGEIRADFLSPEDTLRSAYTRQSFEEFAEPFGLVLLKPYSDGRSRRAQFEIRKTPLLDHVLHFHLGA